MIQSILLFISRVCMSSLFLWAGFSKIMDLEGTAGYMASKQMPFIYLSLAGAILFQITGGLFLLTGYRARLGAWMLILFIIPAMIIFHDFWNFQGGVRLTEQIMFMNDLAILGGLLGIAAVGPGRLSMGNNP